MNKTEIVDCLILRCDRHKEFDLRLTVLTHESLLTTYATGALKPTSKLRPSLQQFNTAQLTLNGSRVTGTHILSEGIGVSRALDRYNLACTIAQTLTTLLREDAEDTAPIYDLACTAIHFLAHTDTPTSTIFIAFYGKLLRLLGYDFAENTIDCIKRAYIEHLDFPLNIG